MKIDSEKFINIIKLGRLIIHGVFLAYLLGALFAVIVGSEFNLYKFLFVYAILFTGTLSAMYNNNYNDVNVDRNSTQTFFSGGSRILVDHPELLKTVKLLSIFFLDLSVFLGFVGVIIFSYPITFFIFVLFGNLAGWYYTASPIKLVYRGFGEIGTMIAAGFLVPGLGYYAIAGTIDVAFVILLLPLLLYGFGMSFYLEMPDIEADRQGQKNTLVVRYGLLFGFAIGALSSTFATICLFIYVFLNVISGNINYWIVILFSIIPLCFSIYGLVKYRVDKTNVNNLVFRSVGSFFFFFILLNVYFLLVIF